jgi:hypothetical protein
VHVACTQKLTLFHAGPRQQWAELVAAADAGTITLIPHGDRGVWAALVPVRDLTEPVDRLPVWSLRDARPKLGDLVAAAHGQWQASSPPTPQVLTRHRRPVAALVRPRAWNGRSTSANASSLTPY